jgi:IMP dehydrogenase
MKKALSFDDILLVPKKGVLSSRKHADLSTRVAGINLKIPVIAANMSAVCGWRMAKEISKLGGLGILHRFMSIEQNREEAKKAKEDGGIVGFSVGIDDDSLVRLEKLIPYSDIVCIDVAHGHSEPAIKFLSKVLANTPDNYPVIFGQISTWSALTDILDTVFPNDYKRLAVKASIGGGSMCTTRVQTGFGVPTLQSVMDISNNAVDVIADGGIKNSGDIVKALAAGASAVMLGKLLAGTDESASSKTLTPAGEKKLYFGSASVYGKASANTTIENIEGESTFVRCTGPLKSVVNGLMDGVRSGISYGGATNIATLQNNFDYVEVSSQGFSENHAHGVE